MNHTPGLYAEPGFRPKFYGMKIFIHCTEIQWQKTEQKLN